MRPVPAQSKDAISERPSTYADPMDHDCLGHGAKHVCRTFNPSCTAQSSLKNIAMIVSTSFFIVLGTVCETGAKGILL